VRDGILHFLERAENPMTIFDEPRQSDKVE